MRLALLALALVAAPLVAPAHAYPCEPQPALQVTPSGTYLVVRDPTQPCSYIRILVPVDIQQ